MSYSTLISGLTNVRSTAFDSIGNIYVANSGNSTVGKYNSSGGLMSASLIAGLTDVRGIALDTQNNVYVLYSGYVGKYNSSGGVITNPLISGLNDSSQNPNIIALDSLGNIYVVNVNDTNNVGKYNSNGELIQANLISGLENSYGIALDSSGNIYVSVVNGTNSVYKYNSSGEVINNPLIPGVFSFTPTQPIALCIDSQGNIYVSYHGFNTVGKYNSSGGVINNPLISGLNRPWSITLDNLGNIYVANSDGNNVGKYTLPVPPPCFKEGSKILTDKGYKLIENLRKGDLVKTLKNDYLPIVLIGKSPIYNSCDLERIKNRLYTLSKDKYSDLTEDLVLTGCHSILVDWLTEPQLLEMGGNDKRLYMTDDKLRLFTYLDLKAEPYPEQGTFDIYHLALENENYIGNYGIWANGLLVESCSKRYLLELSGMELIE